jgi:uncharacterized protein (DUF302 family)
MTYYTSKTLEGSIASIRPRVEDALRAEGFGVLTEIDMSATMKKKLDADIAPYLILGACNPALALRAITAENNIGLMLPCNVILRQASDGRVEVAAVDPMASMQGVSNPALADVAAEVQGKLARVIEAL